MSKLQNFDIPKKVWHSCDKIFLSESNMKKLSLALEHFHFFIMQYNPRSRRINILAENAYLFLPPASSIFVCFCYFLPLKWIGELRSILSSGSSASELINFRFKIWQTSCSTLIMRHIIFFIKVWIICHWRVNEVMWQNYFSFRLLNVPNFGPSTSIKHLPSFLK